MEPLSSLRLAAFVAPVAPLFGLLTPLLVYLPPYYSAELGLPLTTVGTAFMVTRLWDVVSDPFFGTFSDRLETPLGRRRPWLILSVPVLLIAAWHLFMPEPPVTAGYLIGWLLVLYTGWTMAGISFNAWAGELSRDYDERSRIMGWAQIANILGSTVVLVIPVVVDALGDDRSPGHAAWRIAAMGWFVIALLPPAMAISVRTPEPPRTGDSATSVGDSLQLLRESQALRRLLAMDFAQGLATGVNGSVAIFFTSYVLELPELASVAMLVFFVTGLLSVPVWLRVAYRFGKHRAAIGAAAMGMIATALAGMTPAGRPGLAFAAFMLMGCPFGAGSFLPRAMMADVADEEELRSGAQRTGLFYGLLNMTLKVGLAVGPGLAYLALDLVGFEPGPDNPADVIGRLRIVYVCLPIVLFSTVIASMWGYPLDAARQARTRTDLERRRAEEAGA